MYYTGNFKEFEQLTQSVELIKPYLKKGFGNSLLDLVNNLKALFHFPRCDWMKILLRVDSC